MWWCDDTNATSELPIGDYKEGQNILIVDDEKDIRESLGDILTDEGFNVFLAKNASDAIKYKEKQKIDLILLDIWMPDTDGISLLKSWAKNNSPSTSGVIKVFQKKLLILQLREV